MPIEAATYIADLVPANPLHTDGLAQSDSHLRLIKQTLQNTFPNLGDAAVTATAAQINSAISADPLPTASGAFVKMWSGSVSSIPANYHLCDGSTVSINGVNVTLPDLRSKFVIGSDGDTGTYPHGATGGAASQTVSTATDGAHDHTATTGAYQLTIADIPSHNHVLTDPGHFHTLPDSAIGVSGGGGNGAPSNVRNVFNQTNTAFTGITIANTGGGGSHSHSISSSGSAHQHGGIVVPTLPPYYALCFICRIS